MLRRASCTRGGPGACVSGAMMAFALGQMARAFTSPKRPNNDGERRPKGAQAFAWGLTMTMTMAAVGVAARVEAGTRHHSSPTGATLGQDSGARVAPSQPSEALRRPSRAQTATPLVPQLLFFPPYLYPVAINLTLPCRRARLLAHSIHSTPPIAHCISTVQVLVWQRILPYVPMVTRSVSSTCAIKCRAQTNFLAAFHTSSHQPATCLPSRIPQPPPRNAWGLTTARRPSSQQPLSQLPSSRPMCTFCPKPPS